MTKDKKKIALAVPTVANGGAERAVSVWANELSAYGSDVCVVLFYRAENEYSLSSGIPVYSLANDKKEYESMSFLQKHSGLRDILKRIAADYIISFMPRMQAWIMMASAGLKTKRIETLRDNPHQGFMYTNPFYRIGWYLCFFTCYKIILQTKGQLRFFGKREQKKCIIVPNQVSERFVKNYKRTDSLKPTEFIAAGRLSEQKNYEMMVDAFARVCSHRDDIKLRIFGKGDEAETKRLLSLIESAGMSNQIRLMGWTSDLSEEYKKSNFFLMTSNHEGLPNALIEAMASRLICVSTDCETGPGDLIESGITGFLTPVGDSASFAEAIEKALSMSNRERTLMADAARSKILKNYSPQNSVEVLLKCLEE